MFRVGYVLVASDGEQDGFVRSERVCDQRMVVFNAVEERDLRSVNSDACAVRLCCWEAAVMCMPKGCVSVYCVCPFISTGARVGGRGGMARRRGGLEVCE